MFNHLCEPSLEILPHPGSRPGHPCTLCNASHGHQRRTSGGAEASMGPRENSHKVRGGGRVGLGSGGSAAAGNAGNEGGSAEIGLVGGGGGASATGREWLYARPDGRDHCALGLCQRRRRRACISGVPGSVRERPSRTRRARLHHAPQVLRPATPARLGADCLPPRFHAFHLLHRSLRSHVRCLQSSWCSPCLRPQLFNGTYADTTSCYMRARERMTSIVASRCSTRWPSTVSSPTRTLRKR